MERFGELVQEGKFHQLSQKLLEEIAKMNGKEAEKVYQEVVVPNYYNLYPESFAELTSAVSSKCAEEKGISILHKGLSLLIEMETDPDRTSTGVVQQGVHLAKKGRPAVVRLLLDIAQRQIAAGNVSSARIILHDCRYVQMESKESLRRFHLALGMLHYRTRNYSPAFKNLLEYLEMSNYDADVFGACLVSGILSEKVYSFARLISLGENGAALELAKALEEGSEGKATELANKIDPEICETVRRKALRIRLLNYFFRVQQRCVLISDLSSALSLDADMLEETILDILGSGLMRGSIDGLLGEFTYTWIGYKHLTNEEIGTVKEVISALKSRVDQVVEEINVG